LARGFFAKIRPNSVSLYEISVKNLCPFTEGAEFAHEAAKNTAALPSRHQIS
jgi:hypothetical protein